MPHALLLEHVTKRFSSTLAVDDLNLTVPEGCVYGVLGPNGAGKSTTLRMVMSILDPDSGRVLLLGCEPRRERRVLRRVGYLPEERGLHKRMRVLDAIVFFAELKGMARRDAVRDGRAWLSRMELGRWARAKVQTLSKGMQQKVQFIATVLHRPDVLVLDEPFSGLDPVNQEILRGTIAEARDEGRTVILSTHDMGQAEALCDSVCIIAAGRKILDGPVREIRRASRRASFRVELDAPSEAAERRLRACPGLRGLAGGGMHWTLDLEESADPRALLSDLARLDVALARFEHVEPSLHQIFVERVTGAAASREMNRA